MEIVYWAGPILGIALMPIGVLVLGRIETGCWNWWKRS